SLIGACCAFVVSIASAVAAETPLLLQSPSLSKTDIAFAFGGSLWIVPRDGGDARRLVAADPGSASGPLFSPDGSLVAFTGVFDGNQDIYVVPASGGEPKRLTTHPDSDVPIGLTPDRQRIPLRSARHA